MSEQLSRKADIALSNLSADGGLLTPEQGNQFIRNLIDEPTLIRRVRTIPMNAPEREVNKIGFGSRILRAAKQTAGDRHLDAADRSSPDLGKVVLTTKEVQAELRIPYEVLEDNIERDNMEDTILALIAERAALDLEELLINGDTGSGDAYLALHDGVLKRIASNTVDATDAAVDPDLFNDVVKAMPTRFRRNRQALRFFVPSDVEQDYRNDQAKRGTGLGDATLTGTQDLRLYGSGLLPVALMPDTNAIYTNPQNLLFGIQRQVSIETDKDIRGREVIIVLTARIAINIEEELACVKVNNIGEVTP